MKLTIIGSDNGLSYLKMSSVKWRLYCIGLNVSTMELLQSCTKPPTEASRHLKSPHMRLFVERAGQAKNKSLYHLPLIRPPSGKLCFIFAILTVHVKFAICKEAIMIFKAISCTNSTNTPLNIVIVLILLHQMLEIKFTKFTWYINCCKPNSLFGRGSYLKRAR